MNSSLETRIANLEKQVIALANREKKNITDSVISISDANIQISSINEKTKIITTSRKQSDKLGYDWEITMVGDIEASKVYVEQENPVGTSSDNPIIWEEGMEGINYAFYLKDGKIYVYMDGQFVEW